VAPTFSNVSGCPTILIRTLESGVNASPCGKTNFPCSSSVAIILIHEPSGSQSLEFETVEVISRDSISLSAYAKYEYLDFARRHNWKRNLFPGDILCDLLVIIRHLFTGGFFSVTFS
jgi:hypothetical protein